MTTIEINGKTFEVGFETEVGQNTAKLGAVRHIGLRGQNGAFYSTYLMSDGSYAKLVSVGK